MGVTAWSGSVHCLCLQHRELQATRTGSQCTNGSCSRPIWQAIAQRVREYAAPITGLTRARELIDREGIRIRVLGNITMLPSKLQQVMAKAVETSKHNKRSVALVPL